MYSDPTRFCFEKAFLFRIFHDIIVFTGVFILPDLSKKVVVVGGGAAGLMAAGFAAQNGAQALVLEKMKRPARKILITGKGRCNLTNKAPVREFLRHYNKNGRFLRPSFTHFFSGDLIDFFEQRGVKCITERGGRIFPESENARDIVDALVSWSKKQGAKIQTASPISEIFAEYGKVRGVRLKNGKEIFADAVILATGGASYPATGSTGDGYRAAKQLGHTIVPIRPALVPVETSGKTASSLQGLSLKNVNVSVWYDDKKQGEQFGELLFTHFGLSGPAILTLSRTIVDAIREGKKVEVSIDLKPALDMKKLDARLLRDLDNYGKKKIENILKGLLPSALIPVCLQQTGISGESRGNRLNSEQRKQLRLWLKDFRLLLSKPRGFDEAIVTAGGVDTKEVDPRTMESRIIKNLYFAGEILDIDGDTGGYNLQAAFSTGALAGVKCAQ